MQPEAFQDVTDHTARNQLAIAHSIENSKGDVHIQEAKLTVGSERYVRLLLNTRSTSSVIYRWFCLGTGRHMF